MKRTEKTNSKANLAETEVITAVISSEVSMVTNMKDWVVDSTATRHICGNRSAFISYTTINEGEEQVFMSDSRSTPVIGKGKVLLKLTFGKVLALYDVLHVPDIRWNLVKPLMYGQVLEQKQLVVHMVAPRHEATCLHSDEPTETIETCVILKSEQLVTLASSLAQDITTLRSRSNGVKIGCAVPPP
ncbi:hypothetical protein CK203_027865 [Vitis vinifera]|uniref:Retrovirus-related Pol polyprotein from transposon TNT 1-94-like beta-barrel domain-containing protein n=1 Tax=Vitis vinifera TaxID=29760 RepID=A0A438J3G3_VITVI|nr:hypothetical protein CK203_027865 [Vitis vinifera]